MFTVGRLGKIHSDANVVQWIACKNDCWINLGVSEDPKGCVCVFVDLFTNYHYVTDWLGVGKKTFA